MTGRPWPVVASRPAEAAARASSGGGRPGAGRRRAAAARLLAAALAAAAAPACTSPAVSGSRGAAVLVIERITAVPGGRAERPPATMLQSDVCVRQGAGGACGVFDDIGHVTARLFLKDPGAVGGPAAPAAVHFVTLDRFRVRYVRSDGRGRSGVDVPHAWEGALTATVTTDSRSAAFPLVRASAKLEAPLRALAGGGGAVILHTIAEIDFYGRDRTGAGVAATGRIGVDFADWAD